MTSTPTSVAIVGAGLAGARTAEELRTAGFAGSITLLGREEHRPYVRPPLSKTNLLKGEVPDGDLYVHEPTWYSEHAVELRLGSSVDDVDLDNKTLSVISGGVSQALPFDALVLATGSSPRRLDVPGADLAGVTTLRTLDDSNALRAALVEQPHVVLIGGGWIGLEVAAAAATLGGSVTVLEALGMPLGSFSENAWRPSWSRRTEPTAWTSVLTSRSCGSPATEPAASPVSSCGTARWCPPTS